MTDHDLSELLERLASRTSVSSPPSQEMLAAGTRARRRRTTWGVLGAAAAVAVVAGGLAAVTLGSEPAPVDEPAASDTPYTPPTGTRLVGIGHLAVAVPEAWATNELRCGTPVKDTVVVDVTFIETCAFLAPEPFDSVWLREGAPGMFEPDGEAEVDGLPAQRQATTCTDYPNDTTICRGALFVPSENASFEAQSATKRGVEEILSWIHLARGLVAVPGFQTADMDHQDDDSGEHYRTELTRLGFATQTVTRKVPGAKPGYVLEVSPGPGTMLEPGATITVTEVAEPEGPADEVSVGLNSLGPGDSMDYRSLEDAQIRAGGRVVVPLGGSVWIYPLTERPDGRIHGEVTGDALELDPRTEGPNVGRTWNAVQPGTATLTVVLDSDGRRYVIGTVTVVVR
jgi:PASTA domain